MGDSREFWNSVDDYGKVFNVYDSGASGKIKEYLGTLSRKQTVADFGCGHGHLLPFLSGHFERVIAVDFADKCLAKARERCTGQNINFWQLDMRGLNPLYDAVDLAVSVNSILPETVVDADKIISEIFKCLKRGGKFVGILPAMDVVIYLAMLKAEELRRAGVQEFYAFAAVNEEFNDRDFDALSGYFHDNPGGPPQKYFYPLEIKYRFRRAGFSRIKLEKFYYPWEYCRDHGYGYFPGEEEIWDWFVTAEKR